MALLDNIKKEQNYTLTENGALALNSTSDNLVNLFAISGAMRERSDDEIEMMFAKAMAEDRLTATKLALYTRDVRGGLGERKTGRVMLKYLAANYPDIFAKNVAYIPEYGRWDDLVYLLEDAPEPIIPLLKKQLDEDIQNRKEGKPISLLTKWLPSVNTSNKETVRKGRYLAKAFGMSEKEYRKTLSLLRDYLNVVEVNMSANRFEDIVYPEVPSKAMNNYRNAFRRHDEERFSEFLNRVEKGEEKINSSVLYPYDIVEKYLYQSKGADQVLEEQWKALPNYVEGENNFLVMADVSGSMSGRPMATSVGLAMYFAERNKGPFANTFMTFSARPELVTIKGNTLIERIRYIMNAHWDMNTDLESAFNLLLYTAVKYKTPAEQMPDSIVVITDMEIDSCTSGDWLFYDQMKQRFEANGYSIPNVVFWNVNSRNNTYHASFDRKGVQLASGQSVTVFESLVKGMNLTPYEYMLSVLNNERYDRITI
ncbi:MAG: DUF2828 family protein [Erysipelotrichaceae bacterium]|nr:DUF2828 family protein [Erysipelotrichaceae bacterium]